MEEAKESSTGTVDVVAVTACPTGIAHTYMAAEALEKAGKTLGIRIKVETRGSGGAKNILTEEEIRSAKGVIVAADAKVPMERFAGKPLLEVKVADGIHRPQELVKKAAEKNAPVYEAKGKAEEQGQGGPEKAGV